MFGKKISDIIFLDFVNKLIKLNEAIALSEYSGNFANFGEIFPELKGEFLDLYLKVETNRRIGNSRWRKLNQSLKGKMDSVIKEVAGTYLSDKVIKELMEENLPLRMARRAVFFAEKFQFLKAYTLIFEALINTQPAGLNYNERKQRLENSLSEEDISVYHTIRRIRNAIAHGDENAHLEIKEILNSPEELRKWVEKGYELVKKLTTS